MTTPAIILNILLVLCLTSSVVTRSLGLVTADDKPSKKLWGSLLFGIGQGAMATLGYFFGGLLETLFADIAEITVFAMMLVITVKLFVDSMRVLKGKMLYTISTVRDYILLSILASFNTLLMSFMGFCFVPFGAWYWFVLAVVVAGFLWSWFTISIECKPDKIKKMSFIEFSASVFMLVIALLYLFANLFE